MSAYVFVAVGGGSIGLLAGGVLTQALSWHWIFFVNVPIGIATLILGRFLMVENVGLGIKQGVDWVGSVLVTRVRDGRHLRHRDRVERTAGSRPTRSASSASPSLLFVSFIVLESRLANPIMPLRILKLRTLTGSSVIRGLLITGMFSTFFIGALYFEHVLGYSPVKTGLGLPAARRGMAAMSTGITARLVNRFGNKPVMYPAMLLAAGGLVLFASAGQHAGYFPQIFFAFLMLGVGAGASFMPLLQIGMSEIPNADAGLGSGIVNVSQQMAGAVGLAVLSTIAANRTKSLRRQRPRRWSTRLTLGYQLALSSPPAVSSSASPGSPFLLADQRVARGAADAHRREHAEPRDLRAPRPLATATKAEVGSRLTAVADRFWGYPPGPGDHRHQLPEHGRRHDERWRPGRAVQQLRR